MLSPAGITASAYIQFQFFPIFSAKGINKVTAIVKITGRPSKQHNLHSLAGKDDL